MFEKNIPLLLILLKVLCIINSDELMQQNFITNNKILLLFQI